MSNNETDSDNRTPRNLDDGGNESVQDNSGLRESSDFPRRMFRHRGLEIPTPTRGDVHRFFGEYLPVGTNRTENSQEAPSLTSLAYLMRTIPPLLLSEEEFDGIDFSGVESGLPSITMDMARDTVDAVRFAVSAMPIKPVEGVCRIDSVPEMEKGTEVSSRRVRLRRTNSTAVEQAQQVALEELRKEYDSKVSEALKEGYQRGYREGSRNSAITENIPRPFSMPSRAEMEDMFMGRAPRSVTTVLTQQATTSREGSANFTLVFGRMYTIEADISYDIRTMSIRIGVVVDRIPLDNVPTGIPRNSPMYGGRREESITIPRVLLQELRVLNDLLSSTQFVGSLEGVAMELVMRVSRYADMPFVILAVCKAVAKSVVYAPPGSRMNQSTENALEIELRARVHYNMYGRD